MSPALIVVILVVVILVWAGLRLGTARPTPIDPDDPLWREAIERARGTTATLRELHGAGREVWVKFPLRPAGGEREHVWGRLVELEGDQMLCTVETPPVTGRDSARTEPRRVPLSELEDWQVALEDGTIRGGFTTRAQARIAEREGQRVPSHVRAMLGRITGP